METDTKCSPNVIGIGSAPICTKTAKEIENLGRSLVKILRHEYARHGLEMSSDGYVKLGDILMLPNKNGIKTRSRLYLGSHSEVSVLS